ncbi:hypothetical protein ES702_00149 [subsurface metagenome]
MVLDPKADTEIDRIWKRKREVGKVTDLGVSRVFQAQVEKSGSFLPSRGSVLSVESEGRRLAW